jgi:predicted RNA-binding Zn-ribbon protein involved in translation (DUF1610 family)
MDNNNGKQELWDDIQKMKEAVKNSKPTKIRCPECGAFIYHGKNCSLSEEE